MELMAFLILLVPLFASVAAGSLYIKLGEKFALWTTTFGVTFCALLAWVIFWRIGVQGEAPFEATLYQWIATPRWDINFGILVDKLTATMLIVVTTVSACVHWYSLGYMHEDPSKPRFFAYLSFFTFAMLALVTAPNMLQMFLGWEGVGLASYLLIGFWHHKQSANAAAMKAFIVNRIADVGLLLALFVALFVFGTLSYYDIFALAGNLGDGAYIHFLGYDVPTLELFALLLFIGAMGKSAQFGFHTWLPDAMEGPTPVSALIHAATMVTAGVFLVCRMSPVFEAAGGVLTLVAWVGAITALFAATIGLTQRDIKRVIAYSTCSQLGYMFFACGVSAYPAAMFHLTTHAFFKALLFLGAGAVIHALHHEQDMFKMGGVKKVLPATYGLMWIGSLALAGIPPFAGFFSKDLILESAFGAHTGTGYWLYLIGTLAALLTAFYSFRVVFLSFHGAPRMDEKTFKHAHEAPGTMMYPMIVLAVGAVFSGLALSKMGYLEWWHGALVIDEAHHGLHNAHHSPLWVKLLPLVAGVGGILLAVWLYLKRTDLPAKLAEHLHTLYDWSLNKWYIDELYNFIIVQPIRLLARGLWKGGDEQTIDRFGPNGFAALTYRVAGLVRGFQTGFIYQYAFVFITGIVLLLSWMILGG